MREGLTRAHGSDGSPRPGDSGSPSGTQHCVRTRGRSRDPQRAQVRRHRGRPHLMTADTPRHRRLEEARTGEVPWKAGATAAASASGGRSARTTARAGTPGTTSRTISARARPWGEDGIAGISDDRPAPVLSLARWNGADPILKERMFGLANGQGNHGEDVRILVQRRQHADQLRHEVPVQVPPGGSLQRSRGDQWRRGAGTEYELLDAGIFDDDPTST